MPESAAQIFVVVVGVAVTVLSAWGLIVPARLIGMVTGVMERRGGMHAAVIARLLLGVALIVAADASRFPHVLRVLGWIAIIAAAGLLILGQARLLRFVHGFDRFPAMAVRVMLLAGLGFGAFLVYAVAW